MPVAMAWAFGFMAAFLTLSLVPPFFQAGRGPLPRLWAKGVMWIYGIKAEIRGEKYGSRPGPKIVVFNHVSTFDVIVLALIWHKNATIVYKEDFHRIPIMGALMQRMGFIPIKRKKRDQALNSLTKAANALKGNDLTLFISPEGTRSGDGKLRHFKKGPFHLALATKAPLVPLVLTGLENVMPAGYWFARPGKFTAEYLPPISTEHWLKKSLPEHIEEVRNTFLEKVPSADC